MPPVKGSNSRPFGPLAISSPSPSPPLSPQVERSRPSWHRARSSATFQRPSRLQRIRARALEYVDTANRLNDKLLQIWRTLPLWQKIAFVVLQAVLLTLFVLFMVYNESILKWLAPHAESWRQRPGGWLLLWFLIFITAFPPLFGYSTFLTATGFIYGLWPGWLIAATANVAGATCAFLVCRYYFQDWIKRKVEDNQKFTALGLVLKHDGIKLLTMIRLCPLPYSLSNGAMSTFPTVSPYSFAIATAFATPKLLLHCYIGRLLAEVGEDEDDASKGPRYFAIALSAIFGAATGWIIWNRTQARSRQLAAAEAEALMEGGQAEGPERRSTSQGLAHPDAFADDDAQELGDEEISAHNDVIDFLEPTGSEGHYKDDGSDDEGNESKRNPLS